MLIDFIFIGFVEEHEVCENLKKNEKFLHMVGFEPATFWLEVLHATFCDMIYCKWHLHIRHV